MKAADRISSGDGSNSSTSSRPDSGVGPPIDMREVGRSRRVPPVSTPSSTSSSSIPSSLMAPPDERCGGLPLASLAPANVSAPTNNLICTVYQPIKLAGTREGQTCVQTGWIIDVFPGHCLDEKKSAVDWTRHSVSSMDLFIDL
jgi:hypothetical protein